MDGTSVERVRVGVADMAVAADDEKLVTSGLGSCVAIAVHDGNGVGGLLHAMLPEAPPETDRPAKYVDSGLAALVEDVGALGGDIDSLRAKVAGGASMLNLGNGSPVGEQNVAATEVALSATGIDLVAAETGGDSGRSVVFEPASGNLSIKRVDAAETTL